MSNKNEKTTEQIAAEIAAEIKCPVFGVELDETVIWFRARPSAESFRRYQIDIKAMGTRLMAGEHKSGDISSGVSLQTATENYVILNAVRPEKALVKQMLDQCPWLYDAIVKRLNEATEARFVDEKK